MLNNLFKIKINLLLRRANVLRFKKWVSKHFKSILKFVLN